MACNQASLVSLSYFLATVTLNSLLALPAFGWVSRYLARRNHPAAASSAALSVNLASVSPCLMTGLAGSMRHSLGQGSENLRVTSWSKFFPAIDADRRPPWIPPASRLVARFGGSSVKVSSARPTTGLLSLRLCCPGTARSALVVAAGRSDQRRDQQTDE